MDGKGTIAFATWIGTVRPTVSSTLEIIPDKGRSATGVTIHNGYLYTSTKKMVYRNKITPGELVPTSETEVVFTDMEKNVDRNWHTTKPLAFDNKGNMYIPFGSPSDACQDMEKYGPVGIPGGKGLDPCPELETQAGIWRFDADKIGLPRQMGINLLRVSKYCRNGMESEGRKSICRWERNRQFSHHIPGAVYIMASCYAAFRDPDESN